jgi:hypothetical protein
MKKNIKINDLPDVLIIKHLIYNEGGLLKDLLNKLSDLQGKKTTPSNFSQKIKNGHLKVQDLKDICEILEYDIFLEKRQK